MICHIQYGIKTETNTLRSRHAKLKGEWMDTFMGGTSVNIVLIFYEAAQIFIYLYVKGELVQLQILRKYAFNPQFLDNISFSILR